MKKFLRLLGVTAILALTIAACTAPQPAAPAQEPKLPATPQEWITGYLTGQVQIPATLLGSGPTKVRIQYEGCGVLDYEGAKDITTLAMFAAYAESCGAESNLPALLKELGFPAGAIPTGLFKLGVIKPEPMAEIKTDANGNCSAKGGVDLVRECLKFSREAMDRFYPAPAPTATEISISVEGSYLTLAAIKGTKVLSMRRSFEGATVLDEKFVTITVDEFLSAWINGQYVEIQYWNESRAEKIYFTFPLRFDFILPK